MLWNVYFLNFQLVEVVLGSQSVDDNKKMYMCSFSMSEDLYTYYREKKNHFAAKMSSMTNRLTALQ